MTTFARSFLSRGFHATITFFFFLALMSLAAVGQDESYLSPVELKKAVDALRTEIAGVKKMVDVNDYESAVEAIEKSKDSMLDLLKKTNPKAQKSVRPLYLQIVAIREGLALEGAELSDLGAWDSLMSSDMNTDKPDAPKQTVSFSKDIAPWIVSQCGRCHIDRKQGNLSLASHADLMKGSNAGVIVFAGDTKGSNLVTVIESGDMPRGGGKVSPENLEKLKTWIMEGANFDGADSTVTLKSLVPAGSEPAQPELKVMAPTGKETVSFSKDVAPLLIQQCSGCHIAAMRNSGGLRMDNFAQLLRGGNSGPIISPGKSDESLVVKKLRGQSGQRMPAGGRPAMADDKIAMIAKWIDEGAAFDGDSAEMVIDQVANKAWIAGADHDEVRQKRFERARQQWTVVMPKTKADEASNDEFLVLGDVGKEKVAEILSSAQQAAQQIRKRFSIPEKSPLVKGGIAIYAFRQRYEYSEFGKMVESRELPNHWNGHWRKQVVDAYAVVMPSDTADSDTKTLLQLLSSVYVGSFDGVPNWFAEGVGRANLAIVAGRTDPRVQAWDGRVAEVGAKIKDPKTLLENRMEDEDAAIAGYALARTLSDKGFKKQFDAMLKGLSKGASFDKAFAATLGPKEVFIASWLGIKAK